MSADNVNSIDQSSELNRSSEGSAANALRNEAVEGMSASQSNGLSNENMGSRSQGSLNSLEFNTKDIYKSQTNFAQNKDSSPSNFGNTENDEQLNIPDLSNEEGKDSQTIDSQESQNEENETEASENQRKDEKPKSVDEIDKAYKKEVGEKQYEQERIALKTKLEGSMKFAEPNSTHKLSISRMGDENTETQTRKAVELNLTQLKALEAASTKVPIPKNTTIVSLDKDWNNDVLAFTQNTNNTSIPNDGPQTGSEKHTIYLFPSASQKQASGESRDSLESTMAHELLHANINSGDVGVVVNDGIGYAEEFGYDLKHAVLPDGKVSVITALAGNDGKHYLQAQDGNWNPLDENGKIDKSKSYSHEQMRNMAKVRPVSEHFNNNPEETIIEAQIALIYSPDKLAAQSPELFEKTRNVDQKIINRTYGKENTYGSIELDSNKIRAWSGQIVDNSYQSRKRREAIEKNMLPKKI